MIQDLFVVNAKGDNEVLFYGKLDEDSENIPNLPNVLSSLINYSSQVEFTPGGFKSEAIELPQGNFVYGANEDIFVICRASPSDGPEDNSALLGQVAANFVKSFKDTLSEFSGDVSQFTPFSNIVAGLIEQYQRQREVEPAAVPAPQKPARPRVVAPVVKKTGLTRPVVKKAPIQKPPSIQKNAPPRKQPSAASVKKAETSSLPIDKQETIKPDDLVRAAEPIKLKFASLPSEKKKEGPPLTPMKRRTYPGGKIEEYERDEVLWNESQDVMQNYTADFIEGIISRLTIYLSISIQHHYEFEIDFTDYPKKPQLKLPESLLGDLGAPFEKQSYFLQHWDEKIPPHIIEIVRELEHVLMNLKTRGRLTPTASVEATVPDLEPLPELPALTDEEQRLLNKYEDEKKKKATGEEAGKEKKAPKPKKQAPPSPAPKSVEETAPAAPPKDDLGQAPRRLERINYSLLGFITDDIKDLFPPDARVYLDFSSKAPSKGGMLKKLAGAVLAQVGADLLGDIASNLQGIGNMVAKSAARMLEYKSRETVRRPVATKMDVVSGVDALDKLKKLALWYFTDEHIVYRTAKEQFLVPYAYLTRWQLKYEPTGKGDEFQIEVQLRFEDGDKKQKLSFMVPPGPFPVEEYSKRKAKKIESYWNQYFRVKFASDLEFLLETLGPKDIKTKSNIERATGAANDGLLNLVKELSKAGDADKAREFANLALNWAQSQPKGKKLEKKVRKLVEKI